MPVGAKIHARVILKELNEVAPGDVQFTREVIVEREGEKKPCCVVEWLVRIYVCKEKQLREERRGGKGERREGENESERERNVKSVQNKNACLVFFSR